MEILWTKTAEKDLNEIVEYIASDSVETALEKFYKIKESRTQLKRQFR